MKPSRPTRCVFGDPDAPVYTTATPLRGQFVIQGAYPYGPRPGTPDNPFFLNELDRLYEADRDAATRVLQDYAARGANHITTGPVYRGGYSGWYPFTNWIGRPDEFAAFLRWIHQTAPGMYITLFCFSEDAPYLDGETFAWDRIRTDFFPIWTHPDVQRRVARVCNQFERYFDLPTMARQFDILSEAFPAHYRLYHNAPDHLAPGPSLGPTEAQCWQNAIDHGCDGLAYQARPVSFGGYIKLMQYDLFDMTRRFRDGYGGFPTVTRRGERPYLGVLEATANPMMNAGYPEQPLGTEWANGALVPQYYEFDNIEMSDGLRAT